MFNLKTQARQFVETLGQERLLAGVSSLFSGLALGLPAALALAALVRSTLYGVHPHHSFTLAAAALIPALRTG